MKITHVITGLSDGGAEGVLYRLCTMPPEAVHFRVISLMDDGKYGPLLRSEGVEVTCLNMPQGRVTVTALWRLWRLLRRQRPDAVQTWMYHADLIGGVVARLAGIRRVFWGVRHSTLDATSSKRSTIWVARLCAWLSSVVPIRIVCCAQQALEVHRRLGYTARKLLVIPNGYDLARFAPDSAARNRLRAEWRVGERWVLGMVARFDPQKDHKNLLEALAQLKRQKLNFVAVLVGYGLDNENSQLSASLQALDLTDHVRLLGQRPDVPAVMNALDVHVLSSAYGEAFPNVVAEAMACGTPTVVTDVGDAAAIVGDTGWVVRPRDAAKLAAALSQAHDAMEDAEAWQIRQRAARQRVVDNFSLERMVQRYHEAWAIDP